MSAFSEWLDWLFSHFQTVDWWIILLEKFFATQLGQIIGAIVATIILALGAKDFLQKSGPRIWRAWWLGAPQPMSPAALNLVVADLDNDNYRFSNTRSLCEGLIRELDGSSATRSIAIQRALETVSVGATGNHRHDLLAGHHSAQAIAIRLGADLVVWGEVVSADRLIRVYVTPRTIGTALEPAGYQIDHQIELPIRFAKDLAAVLIAQLSSDVAPVFGGMAPVGRSLEDAVQRLDAVVAAIPTEIVEPQHIGIVESAAVCHEAIGEKTGNLAEIEMAIRGWRKSADYWREKSLERWAASQNRVAKTLQSLSRDPVRSAALLEAVDVYRDVLKAISPSSAPEIYASTSSELGKACLKIGETTSDRQNVEAACDAFRAAESIWTKNANRLSWAMVKDDLGDCLSLLAEFSRGSERRDKYLAAISEFRSAIVVWAEDDALQRWASSHSNMAAAYSALGALDRNTDYLVEAEKSCREVLTVWTRETRPHDWALAMNNLGNTYRRHAALLIEGAAVQERLTEAITCYESALEVRTSKTTPLDWATTEHNLASAYRLLGQIAPDPDYVLIAVAKYSDVLAVWDDRNADHLGDRIMALTNLGVAYMSYGEFSRDASMFQLAREQFANALDHIGAGERSLREARLRKQIGLVVLGLAKLNSDTDLLRQAQNSLVLARERFEVLGLQKEVQDIDRRTSEIDKLAIRYLLTKTGAWSEDVVTDADFEEVKIQDRRPL